MVPSVSVPLNEDIAVAPAVDGIVVFVALFANGGLLPIGIVIVAGLISVAPLLSVAVKVKASLPEKVPSGSLVNVVTCTGVWIWPAVTAIPPTNNVPCNGKVKTV